MLDLEDWLLVAVGILIVDVFAFAIVVEWQGANDKKSWKGNKPTAYLDGREVDIDTLDINKYNYTFDSENNTVKFSSRH